SSRRRHTSFSRDWSSDVCSSDLNPPFGITTALLRRLTAPASPLEGAGLVLPAWAAARWANGRGTGGAAARRTFHCMLGPRVPARAFRPAPPADARVLLITRSQRW